MYKQALIYGVLGHPVAHSLSPAMHNAAFTVLKIHAEYRRFDIAPEDLQRFCVEARRKYAGFSVTAPHKETIMQLLDKIDAVAVEIGAVNTVVNRNGKLIGYNTDWIGVQKALEESGTVLQNQKVLVLGAGGAAKAVVYACVKAGAEVRIFNRTKEKAVQLGKKWGARVGTLDDATTVGVIINTTSAKESLLSPAAFQKGQIVMDCVYNPPVTEFLRNAQKGGAKTMNGLPMLLHQGVAQCTLWTRQRAPAQVMRAALDRFFAPA